MVAKGFRAQLSRIFGRALSEGLKKATEPAPTRSRPTRSTRPKPGPATRSKPGTVSRSKRGPATRSEPAAGGYAGDFTGKAALEYAPQADGQPDPGEVVWAWVPFEEDHSQGKDRPVLVIARHGGNLLGLMLTSKDHDRDEQQEARYGRVWLDLGPGAWDREGRPSEVRLDRILQLDPAAVRREGAALDRAAFKQVAAGVKQTKGW